MDARANLRQAAGSIRRIYLHGLLRQGKVEAA